MTKKALSLKQFIDLPQPLQFEALHKNGAYVGKRKNGHQLVLLFQLHGYYVEVYYEHYRQTIDHIVTTDSTEILQPYLEQINIGELDNQKKRENDM